MKQAGPSLLPIAPGPEPVSPIPVLGPLGKGGRPRARGPCRWASGKIKTQRARSCAPCLCAGHDGVGSEIQTRATRASWVRAPEPRCRSREAEKARAPAPVRGPCWPPPGVAAEPDDVSAPRHGLRLPEGRAGRGGGRWAPGPGSGARLPRQRGALRRAGRPSS